MKEFELKYGCNPNQKPAKIYMNGDKELPIEILSGRPGYINFLDALQLDNAKKTLYKEIQQAWYNAAAAESKYTSSHTATVASEESFKLMSEKYENGKANAVEYNEAKQNLMKSQSDELQAKYDYLFRTKILDFYKGEPIE